MILYLCRHAIAEDVGPGQSDADRALTAEGIRKLRAAAKGFVSLQPDVARIFSSPLLRARQTAEILAEAFVHQKVRLEVELMAPLAPGSDLSALLRHVRDARDTGVLAVGHEPGMSGLLGELCFGAPGRCKMKKGAIAAIDLPAGQRRGTLLYLLQPAQLRALG